MGQGTLFKTHSRHYPVPDNYPVDSSFIPDMPIETFHLNTTGRITPEDRRLYGWKEMTCSICGRETAMFLNREPIPPHEFRTRKRPLSEMGLVWGQDVTVICACCSFSPCQHCLWRGEMVIGHQVTADGKCSRCGKRCAVDGWDAGDAHV